MCREGIGFLNLIRSAFIAGRKHLQIPSYIWDNFIKSLIPFESVYIPDIIFLFLRPEAIPSDKCIDLMPQ